jgi:hypothetical protein
MPGIITEPILAASATAVLEMPPNIIEPPALATPSLPRI